MKFSIVFCTGDERFVKYYKQAFDFLVNPGTGRRISLSLGEIEDHIMFHAPDGRAALNIVFDTDGQRVSECFASITPAYTSILFCPSRDTQSVLGKANCKLRDCMILCCEHGDKNWPERWPDGDAIPEDDNDIKDCYEQRKAFIRRPKRIPLNPIYSAPLPLP